jgi:hypothetical protein
VEIGSGATILLKVHLDFLVPLGIALSNGSICREDELYSAAVSISDLTWWSRSTPVARARPLSGR